MKQRTIYLIIAMAVVWAIAKAYNTGKAHNQQDIEDRAMELPDPGYETDTYTWDDIEYVVHGESQQ